MALAGAGWGRTQRWKAPAGRLRGGADSPADPPSETADLTGYQVEVGALFSCAQNLYLQAMATDEHRVLQADGGTVGGFQNPTDPASARRSQVRRLGLELTYRVGA